MGVIIHRQRAIRTYLSQRLAHGLPEREGPLDDEVVFLLGGIGGTQFGPVMWRRALRELGWPVGSVQFNWHRGLWGESLSDLLWLRIPNWVVVAIAALYPIYVLSAAQPVAWQGALVLAALVFAIGFALYSFRLLGGGDVKLLAVVALWAGPLQITAFLLSTAIIGGLLAGYLGGRYRKKYLLSGIYLARAAVITLFMIAPKSELSVWIFSAGLGVLWLGTVPLTSGLVGDVFGARYMATLFGFVMFSHQIGAFFGAWLGGLSYDLTGSYTAVWLMAVALGLLAAVLHWPISDRPLAETRTPRPAPHLL
ncbi:MAG: prepilin peptidase [Proteobacteria bacterium]|nr:prepilin peptidase [Pseudomonadota bacterium]